MKLESLFMLFMLYNVRCHHRNNYFDCSSFSSSSSSSSSFDETFSSSSSCDKKRVCRDRYRHTRHYNKSPCLNIKVFDIVQPLRQIEMILKSLFCSSTKIIKVIFSTLSGDLQKQLESSTTTGLGSFVTTTKELEDSVIKASKDSLTSLGVLINQSIDEKNAQLQKETSFNSSTLLADFNAYIAPIFALEDIPAAAALVDPITGLIPTFNSLVAALKTKNSLAVDKAAASEIASIDALVKQDALDLAGTIAKLFKTFVSNVKTGIATFTDLLIKNALDIVSKTEKALICGLDGCLHENFRLMEFLLRRCLEILCPGFVNRNVFPFVFGQPQRNSPVVY